MGLTLATATRSAMAVGLKGTVLTGSTIEIRSGTRPSTADTASTGTTLLATVALASTAFTESDGVLTLADPAPVTGVATGTASWFRLVSGSATVLDGSVTTSAVGTGDLLLATTSITTGLTVDISSGGTITMPAGTAT